MDRLQFSSEYLTVTGDVELLPDGCLNRLIDAFYRVYPTVWDRFGKGKFPSKVTYAIEGNYDGVAYTAGLKVGLNPKWMQKHPEDLDCMTHELIHVAQQYPSYRHSWLVEGIADYGRDVYGINNEAAGWKLPDRSARGSFRDGYGRTAAFLKFIEKEYDKNIVDVCHLALRFETFQPELFVERTGKTLDALWLDYTNPHEERKGK